MAIFDNTRCGVQMTRERHNRDAKRYETLIVRAEDQIPDGLLVDDDGRASDDWPVTPTIEDRQLTPTLPKRQLVNPVRVPYYWK